MSGSSPKQVTTLASTSSTFRNLTISIDARYWTTLIVASVLGTNTGDYAAEILGLGHLAGLPWLAGLLALVFAAQRITRSTSPLFFWAAIIVIRTAATNVGDVFLDHKIPFGLSVPLIFAVYVVFVGLYARTAGGTLVVNPLYWATMIVAGVLGTIGGDAASFGIGLFVPGTAVVFGALALAAIVALGRRGLWTVPVAYWTILALVRTAGTGGGDTLSWILGTLLRSLGFGRADGPSYVVGIAPATFLSGAAFLALLWRFYVAPVHAQTSTVGRS